MILRLLRYRISFQIFLSFALIAVLPAIVFYIAGKKLILNTIEYEANLRLTESIEGFRQQINYTEEECLRFARHLSKNKDLISYYRNGEIDKLTLMLSETLELGVIDLIEIENAEGRVATRGHNPLKYGDNKVNQDIIRAGLSGIEAVSFEEGFSGVAIRAVAPILFDSNVIGLVMTGMTFSERFAEHIKKLTEMENGVYLGNKKIISSYSGFDIINKETLEKLRQNQNVIINNVLINGENARTILKPIFIMNKYWGALALAVSKTREIRYISNISKFLISAISAAFIAALIIFIFIFKKIYLSLNAIIGGIHKIKFGNFDNTIDLKTKNEFGAIAESFNDLMKKINVYDKQIKKLQDESIKSAKLSTTGQISAGLAHEIRNPLSSIRMMVQIVGQRYNIQKDCNEMNVILREIDRINSILKNLLEYSKPSAINFQKIDVNQLLIKSLELFKYNFEHQKIIVERDFQNKTDFIFADFDKLLAVFINLIINSIQAMPKGGKIKISTRTSKNYCNIFIIDNGCGIAGDKKKTVFEPFYTTKKEGTGLGLALVKMIIERHNGKIRIFSKESKGVIILIKLPVNINAERI